MQAAKEYDLQFNNILKKEEYKKYVAIITTERFMRITSTTLYL